MTDVVRFAEIDHPSFPPWVTEGLDALFAEDARLDKVYFDFWVVSLGGRGREVDLRGSAVFRTSEGVDMLSEDELDRIPQVRMFERRAKELWKVIPLTYTTDEYDSVNGQFEFWASRSGVIHFSFVTDYGGENGDEVVMEARFENGGWTMTDRIILVEYDGAISDLLADPAAAFAGADLSGFELVDNPVPIRVRYDAENERFEFDFTPGEITRCMAKR